MSHQPQRKEKNCLNCGITVAGRYCQQCGQENVIPKQSVWGLITHFIYDIFHFDGKFFHTLKHLLFKPGFIPKEYIAGKRMSYLDPIRMYLFTSAVFFLIFFAIGKGGEGFVNMRGNIRLMTKLERLEYSSVLNEQIKRTNGDSISKTQLNLLLDTSMRIVLYDTMQADSVNKDSSFQIQLHGRTYIMEAAKIVKGQDELQVSNDWFGKRLNTKWKSYKAKFGDDEKAMLNESVNSFFRKFPYILFVSLPFFALILKLLYARRKHFYYSDHAVFTLYHYIFTFILLLILFFLSQLNHWLEWKLITLLTVVLFFSGGVYLLLAMKRFYLQGWGKTLIKFLLLNILAFITIVFLLLIFILLSIFQL